MVIQSAENSGGNKPDNSYVYEITLNENKKKKGVVPHITQPVYKNKRALQSEATKPSDSMVTQGDTKSNENSENNEVSTFSLSAPVEETKDLLVLHNTYENKLLKQLNLEGFPMPSLAVTNQQHTNFGPISIIFE